MTEQVHASQVAQVQKQAKTTSVPMDVGALSQQLIAVLAGQRAGGHVSSPQVPGDLVGEWGASVPEVSASGEDSIPNQVLEALRGKGKGEGKGASQQ